MALLTAQYIIKMKTMIPADDVVNTFHFLTPSDVVLPLELDDIVAALKQFYDDGVAPSNTAVGGILSDHVSISLRRIKIRKRSRVVPTATLREETYNSPTPPAAGEFPHEVALCLSARGQVTAGELQRRRRARQYIGPLSDQSVYIARTGGDVRPSALTRGILSGAAARLRDRTGPAIWATASTVDDVGRPIVNGWVDDAYDTQRRRGTKALTRTVW